MPAAVTAASFLPFISRSVTPAPTPTAPKPNDTTESVPRVEALWSSRSIASWSEATHVCDERQALYLLSPSDTAAERCVRNSTPRPTPTAPTPNETYIGTGDCQNPSWVETELAGVGSGLGAITGSGGAATGSGLAASNFTS